MAQKSLADLINSGARKSVKRVSSYTQGNIRQTNIREARGRSDVGGQSAEMAEFLKGTMKVGGFALDAHNKASNEEALELARQAKADYKNATPEQLQKYRDGERMGVFPLSENPYYEAEIRRNELEAKSYKFSEDFSKEFTRWSTERGPDEPKDFDSFVDQFMTKGGGAPQLGQMSWQEQLATDDPVHASEGFWPVADAVIESKRNEFIKKEEENFKFHSKDKLKQNRGEKINRDPELWEKAGSGQPISEAILDEVAFSNEMDIISDLIEGVAPERGHPTLKDEYSINHTGEQVAKAFEFISGKKGTEVKDSIKAITEYKGRKYNKTDRKFGRLKQSGDLEQIVAPVVLADVVLANVEMEEDQHIETGANSLNNIPSQEVSKFNKKPKRNKYKKIESRNIPKFEGKKTNESTRVVHKELKEPPSATAMENSVETVKRKVQGVIGLESVAKGETKRFGEEEFKPEILKFAAAQGWDESILPSWQYGYNGGQLQMVHNPQTPPDVLNGMLKFIQRKWDIGYAENSDNSSTKVLTDEGEI